MLGLGFYVHGDLNKMQRLEILVGNFNFLSCVYFLLQLELCVCMTCDFSIQWKAQLGMLLGESLVSLPELIEYGSHKTM
jgi:hypothetical protein